MDHSASYFNHSDPDAKAVRESLAEESLESLIKWLKREGNVGILGEYREDAIQKSATTNDAKELTVSSFSLLVLRRDEHDQGTKVHPYSPLTYLLLR